MFADASARPGRRGLGRGRCLATGTGGPGLGRGRVRGLVRHWVLAMPARGAGASAPRYAERRASRRPTRERPRYPCPRCPTTTTPRAASTQRARPPRHRPLAPRARADRLRRRGRGPRRSRTARRGDLADGSRLSLPRGRAPRRCPGQLPGAARALLRPVRRPRLPCPGAAHPVAPDPRRVPRTPCPVPPERLPPGDAQLLHACPAADLDRRRGAGPVGEPGDRRLVVRAGRGVRRRGGRPLALRPRRVRTPRGSPAGRALRGGRRRARELRRPCVGRDDGQHHGPDDRPRRPSSPPRRSRRRGPAARRGPRPRRHGRRRSPPVPAASARRGTRGLAHLHLRPGPLLDRQGDRLPRLPRRDAGRRPRPTSASASGARRRGANPGGPRGRPPPLAISAVVGTTNTGSVDATAELADVAARHGLWLHVDAAYGGAALLSQRDAPRVPDLARADSITIDPHKWFFQAYDIGGLLVRRRDDLEQTFHRRPEYYRTAHHEEQPLNWYELALEGTRRWRALKLWMSWKHLGTAGFGRLVEANSDLAAHLADQIAAADDLEAIPAGRPELSVVCFRHLPGGPAARGGHRGGRSGRPRPLHGPPGHAAPALRRRLALDHRPARPHVPARGDRQRPQLAAGGRPGSRRAAAPLVGRGPRSGTAAERLTDRGRGGRGLRRAKHPAGGAAGAAGAVCGRARCGRGGRAGHAAGRPSRGGRASERAGGACRGRGASHRRPGRPSSPDLLDYTSIEHSHPAAHCRRPLRRPAARRGRPRCSRPGEFALPARAGAFQRLAARRKWGLEAAAGTWSVHSGCDSARTRRCSPPKRCDPPEWSWPAGVVAGCRRTAREAGLPPND